MRVRSCLTCGWVCPDNHKTETSNALSYRQRSLTACNTDKNPNDCKRIVEGRYRDSLRAAGCRDDGNPSFVFKKPGFWGTV